MGTADRQKLLVLVFVIAVAAGVALVPAPYHRWWWWDVLMHALIAGLLAVWRHALEIPPRWAWPAFVTGMLAWEWLELSTPLLFSPNRADVLKDLTVNVVSFWTMWALLAHDAAIEDGVMSTVVDRQS